MNKLNIKDKFRKSEILRAASLAITGFMLLFDFEPLSAANVVSIGGSSTGPGSFTYEISQANSNSEPVTFAPTANGQTCYLQGDVPLPSGLTNMVTIDTSGFTPPLSFTIVGNTQELLPIYAISNSGSGTGGTTFTGNGSITFDRSGFFNRSSGTFLTTFTGGSVTFTIDSGIVNQSTGTMINTFTGGTFSLPFLSGVGNGGAGKMINNVSGGTFLFAGGSGFGNTESGTQINNISGGTISFTNNVLSPFNNFSTGTQINNISGGSITLFGSTCFLNQSTGVHTNNISGGNLSYTGVDTWGFVNQGTGTTTNTISGGMVSFSSGATGFVNSGGGTMNTLVSGGIVSMDDTRAAFGTTLNFSGRGIFSSGVNGVTFGGDYEGQGYTANLTFSSSTATHQAAIGKGGLPVQMVTPASATGTSTATLGGARLNVISTTSPSDLVGTSYVIMDTAIGPSYNPSLIAGTYGTLTSSSLIKYRVVYDPLSVTVIPNEDQSFAGYAGHRGTNAFKMAHYLDTLSHLAGDPAFIALNDLILAGDLSGYQDALNEIQPSQLQALSSIGFNNMTAVIQIGHTQMQSWFMESELQRGMPQNFAYLEPGRIAGFTQLVTQQMTAGGIGTLFNSRGKTLPQKGSFANLGFSNGPEQVNRHPLAGRIQVGKTNVWFEPYGQLTSQKGNHNGNPHLKSRMGGLALGADYEVDKNTILGILGGTSTTPFSWDHGRGWGHMNSLYGGLYAAWMEECGFYLEGQAFIGRNWFKTTRKIHFSTIDRRAKERHHAFQFTGNLELGYTLPICGAFTFRPFIMADYMVMHESKYKERGAGSLNMNIKSRTSQFFQGELGAMVYTTFAVDDVLLRPTAELGWVQRRPVGDNKNKVKGGLVNEPSTLVVTGANKVYNQIAPGAGLIAQFANGLYVSGNIYAQAGNGLKIGEALIRLGYQF